MLMPSGTAPSCGWPLVVYVHPLGGTRFDDFAMQLLFASQGFAVWSYDVRGQGEAGLVNVSHPNAGCTLWGAVERHDLAEQIQFASQHPLWQATVDGSRVGVVGRSQGGAHAWMAAAWSGSLLQLPGRSDVQLPTIACAVAHDLVADPLDGWLRGGALFSSWWVAAISGTYEGVPFDPAFVANGAAAFLAQSPSALVASWLVEGRGLADRLASSTVPMLYEHAYLDNVNNPLSGIQRLESMQGPTRAVLGTIGHGSPLNGVELEMRHNMALRWLTRFLWNEPNEVDVEQPHLLAFLPLDAADRDDPDHLWSRAQLDELTTPATATRLYLHDDFALRVDEDTAPAQNPVVEQVVEPLAVDFTADDYLGTDSLREAANVMARCPLSDRVWTYQLTKERELLRSPTVHLHVVPDDPEWMVAVLLTAQPPGGEQVMLAANAVASRASSAGVAEVHDVRLPPVAVRLPAGTTLRLKLRNLWLQEAPMVPRLDVAPMFHDFRVDIVVDDGGVGSWVDLPLQDVAPRLVADRLTMALDSADPVAMQVRGGEVRANTPYFAVVGLSGQVPATPLFGDDLPIEADWLAIASAGGAPGTYYTGFFGLLDDDGEATCSFDYSSAAPLPQLLNGWHLTVTAFAWDGPASPTGTACNAVDVMLR